MIPQCKTIREDILKISYESGHGHIPSCFSVVEILYAVYDSMKHDPGNPSWDGRDVFILSKGHASLALDLYAGPLRLFLDREGVLVRGLSVRFRVSCRPVQDSGSRSIDRFAWAWNLIGRGHRGRHSDCSNLIEGFTR